MMLNISPIKFSATSLLSLILISLTSPAYSISTITDKGIVDNTALKVTVKGVNPNAEDLTVDIIDNNGNVVVEDISPSQTGTGTTRMLNFSGVASTTPRKGWMIRISDGVMTKKHTVKTSLGIKRLSLNNTQSLRSDLNVVSSQSNLTLTLPDNRTFDIGLSGSGKGQGLTIDTRTSLPTYGDTKFKLISNSFDLSGQGSFGDVDINLGSDLEQIFNLSSIWNSIDQGYPSLPQTATSLVDLTLPLEVDLTGIGIGLVTFNGTFSGIIDFAEDFETGGASGFNALIEGTYSGSAIAPCPICTVTTTQNTDLFRLDGTISLTSNTITVPESSSPLSLLVIGIGGTALTLKRKLKLSKSAEKRPEKVS